MIEFPELEPTEEFRINVQGYFSDLKYVVKRNGTILYTETASGENSTIGVLTTIESCRAHLLKFVEREYVTVIETTTKKTTVDDCYTYKKIVKMVGAVSEEYTSLKISVAYDDVFTLVRLCPDGDKTELIFQTFSNIDDYIRPVVEFYKVVKNHRCALRHVNKALSMVCALEDSHVVIEHENKKMQFDRFDVQCPSDRTFHDELVETAWCPALMRNCIDENELDRWK
jgi:hypothetical protein